MSQQTDRSIPIQPLIKGPNTPASVHAVNARRDTGSVGLTTQYLQEDRGDGRKSISPSLLNSSTPQLSRPETPQIAPSSSSAPTTPSTGADSQTYSFVFTSSRQPGTIAGDSLIGIINPSSSKQFSAPKRPPVLPKQRRKSTLTPEQIRAHALGAVHAISESSPFHPGDNARPSTVAQMDLPIQTPMLSSNVDPIDRSLQRQGIDVYVNAARQGRNKASQASPTSPRPQTVRSYSHATTLESLGEETKDQIFHEPPSPTTMSEAPSRRWPKQRKIKNYARYVEDESNDASFTTTNILGRRTPSLGSSASSSHSKQSIDESLTGLSCFGVIGSGTPGGVFGSAVINTGRAQSTEQHLLLTQYAGGSRRGVFPFTDILAGPLHQTLRQHQFQKQRARWINLKHNFSIYTPDLVITCNI